MSLHETGEPGRPHSRERLRTLVRRYLRQYGMFQAASNEKARYGARSLWQSIGYAWEGLRFALRTERNLRIDLYLVLGAYALGFLVELTQQEWVLLTMMMTLVLFSELANTTVEWLVDLITEGRYDLRAKRIKDISAAACLVVALGGYSVAFMLFRPYLAQIWFGAGV